MTYLWQEERGIDIFRFQTDEKIIFDKMVRKKNFKLVAKELNAPLWIFKASFYSSQKARKALEILTGRPVKKDSEEGVYFA